MTVAQMGANLLRSPTFLLSDEECKQVREHCPDIKQLAAAILEEGPPFNDRELSILIEAAGDMEGYNYERDGDMWRDDVLEKYAEYIQNYEYTYKPEAQSIDPNIDPDEKHIGPMAQDIEKVNPACVKETPEGVKTVDTGRLALMNAGAIAALAREVKELKNE